jgi:hypothetical protein
MVSERSKHVTPFSLGPQRRGQNMPPTATLPKAAAQADSTAADVATLKADFNALLAKLRAATLMEP